MYENSRNIWPSPGLFLKRKVVSPGRAPFRDDDGGTVSEVPVRALSLARARASRLTLGSGITVNSFRERAEIEKSVRLGRR